MMAEVYRTGYIYIQDVYAGMIKETDSGYLFVYDKKYLERENPLAASITLPLRPEEFISTTLFPFFDGLIPEGWLLDVVSRNWKIDRNDRFGLLISACKDCIGDVSIRNEEGI